MSRQSGRAFSASHAERVADCEKISCGNGSALKLQVIMVLAEQLGQRLDHEIVVFALR
ncbi:hypothetical protein D3C86_2043190 [compost metagenome]